MASFEKLRNLRIKYIKVKVRLFGPYKIDEILYKKTMNYLRSLENTGVIT